MKGSINVKTENIFPVIKKFLYSDHEIFLREIVSNAVDATQKLKTLSSLGEFKGEFGDCTIDVKIDEKAKTLTVIDHGVGMSKEEVEKYITQIAFSGAEEFVEKYKGKSELEANSLIGHFGLGFFSSFMVSDLVEIRTKSYKDTPGVHWTCDGSTDYTIEECDKSERGTEVIMHIDEASSEFLQESKILELLNKYCKFMPVAIRFGQESVWEDSETEKDDKGNPKRVEKKKDRIINDTNPLWKQKPSDLKDEDYNKFFHKLYPMNFDEPLFHIHLNVDYPFNLTGILYFPKVKKNIDPTREKIQLYCNQVFVTDSVEGVVPEYMMLMRGVLDSPDIPLNVSRSYLQADGNVKKISSHISKKVAEKLEQMYKDNKEEFLKKWDDLAIFIKYGMISDEKFYERMNKVCQLKNVQGEYFTFEDYKKKIETAQTDKDKKLVYLYAQNVENQYPYIQAAKDKGYDVLLMDGILDSHFIQMLEQKFTDSRFARIDSDTIDKLIPKDEVVPSKLNEDECKKVKEMVEMIFDKEKFSVQTESMEQDVQPFTITQNEFMRRMKEMSEMGGGMASFYGDMPEHYNVVVNTNHEIISQILNEQDTEKRVNTLNQLKDLALLQQGLLKGEALDCFIKRSVQIIK
ncbi:MAG: molecular chaperone HtpG [Candidatus Onthomorpha sp.]|nr:molecular chaperone HtpG [Bacteroidales bacterium]MDY4583920.1 molecular chaperone HtpG [Candidatus Onthomorpha sp.]MCI5715078.1 molecular chaperone HtpG [Bacteroidales bacterium]MCI6416712.1 molecular chaperone HtpG [Bacteroidales bacterium]MCI6645719.1 molecular chaperone HtpG [Bacteroidales bacterium]